MAQIFLAGASGIIGQGKGGHPLIAREAKSRKQGSTLFLDVPTPSGATAVLKFDGTRFVKLN